jgi:ABC-type transporter Mla subunit MlaD
VARIPGIDGLFAALQTQTEALSALPAAVSALTGAVRNLGEVVGEARETLAAVHRLAVRLDGVAAELDEPLRALAPGLGRLAVVLDDPAVEQLPETLRAVQRDVLPVLQTLTDTHQRVAFIAGSTERIMSFVDETSRTFGGLPGAALLGRRRPAPRPFEAGPRAEEPPPDPPTPE